MKHKMVRNKYIIAGLFALSVAGALQAGLDYSQLDEELAKKYSTDSNYSLLSDEKLAKEYNEIVSEYIKIIYEDNKATSAWIKCLVKERAFWKEHCKELPNVLCEELGEKRNKLLFKNLVMLQENILIIEAEIQQRSGAPIESFPGYQKAFEVEPELYRHDKLQYKDVQSLKEKEQKRLGKDVLGDRKNKMKLLAIQTELKNRSSLAKENSEK